MVNILNSIKSVLPKTSTILTKGAGLAALGVVLSDAHYIGKMQADLYSSEKDAASTGKYLHNSLYLSSMSKSEERIRDFSYHYELDQTWKRFFNEGIGYIKGFTTALISKVIPFGMGLGAVLMKGAGSKACAIGVALYSAYSFIKNFFGLGTPPGLDKFN